MRNDVYQATARDHADDEVEIEIKQTVQVPLLLKITLAVLILIVILLTIGLVVQGNKLKAALKKDTCSSTKKSVLGFTQDTNLAEDPSVFQDLTEKEINAVRDYMLKQTALKLVPFDRSKLSDNLITLIELYLPKKKEVLSYLDHGGKKPVRRARVVVANGGKKVPDVQEYLVEPLPNPSKHYELEYKRDRTSIPFVSRVFTNLDYLATADRVRKAADQCYFLMKESFGYWYNNCTDRCLFFQPNGIPATSKVGERKFWISLARRVEGLYLHVVPLQFRIDMTSQETEKWTVDKVMYNFQLFESVADLVEKYRKGQLRKVKVPIPSQETLTRTSLKPRKSKSGEPLTRGPILVEPDGKRFSIKNRYVKYKDWSFHVGLRSSAGLALYDVRFGGNRIAYEISLQEGAAYYSAYAPQPSSSYYLDSAWGLGWSSQELIKNIDCPETAVYLDTYHFFSAGKVQRSPNSICIFEMNNGVTTRRHRDWLHSRDQKKKKGLWFLGGLVNRAIVVRTVTTPYNYDYVFDYILYDTGVIEVRTGATGYALHTFYDKLEDPYGYQTLPGALAQVHDHFILHKVDLDIAGTGNSFQTLDMTLRNVSYKWEPGTYRSMKTVVRSTHQREMDAVVKYNFDKPKYYLFINEQKKNRLLNPRAYRIVPNSMVKQLYPDTFFPSPAAAWMKYQIAVTKHKDGEPFGSSMFNQFDMASPVVNFDSFIKDNENIQGEDLVAWVSSGGLHIPNTEDLPVTTIPGAMYSFFLKPFGYFDEDPSMTAGEAYYEHNDAN